MKEQINLLRKAYIDIRRYLDKGYEVPKDIIEERDYLKEILGIKNAEIERTYYKTQTNGVFKLLDSDFVAYTLELPWKENIPMKSCYPEGYFLCLPDNTGRFQWYKILDVPGREDIEIHQGSFVKNFLGCTGLGLKAMDLDNDGLDDLRHCKPALKKLKELAPNGFELFVYS